MKTTRQVKEMIAAQMNDRKKGITVSVWQPKAGDDIDRIVIKFPRNLKDYVMLTHLTDSILTKYGFHVAQVMGFMEQKKLWLLLIRDRRK